MIAQSLEYATASPLWSTTDRAYLEYLKTVTASKMAELESGVMNNSANTNAANNAPINNAPINNAPINNVPINNVPANNGSNNIPVINNVPVNNGGSNNNWQPIAQDSNDFGPQMSIEEIVADHRGYLVIYYEDSMFQGMAAKIVNKYSGEMLYRQSFDSIIQAGANPREIALYLSFINQQVDSGAWPENGGLN